MADMMAVVENQSISRGLYCLACGEYTVNFSGFSGSGVYILCIYKYVNILISGVIED